LPFKDLMPRSSLLLLTFACACCAVLGASPAHAAPAEFDAFLLERADRPVPELKAVATAADRWAVEGQVSATEPRFGVPSFFWAWRSSGGERTLRDMGLNAVQAARRHLVAHASLYRTTAGHLAEARVAHVHDLGDGGAVIVSFQQDVKGVRVFRDEVRVVMTPQLELVALSGALTPQLKPLGTFELTVETALTVAYQDLTNAGRESVPLKALGVEGGWQLFALAQQPTPARARSVWYPRVSGIEPAYQLELDASVGTDDLVYSYVVSARDGAVLSRHSLTAADAYSYRLWVDPVPPHFPLDGPQGRRPHATPDRAGPTATARPSYPARWSPWPMAPSAPMTPGCPRAPT
jgi:hypothetical protein